MSAHFTIYRSSAGSGKTRTLAKEYLKLALKNKAIYFRHILGVTFTNKSTQEMKDRILSYLNAFVNNEPNDLSEELQQELKLDPSTFQAYASDVRAQILHDYSHFAISTIDAFFQKIIRSFTREAGLAGDYRLEIETEPVMSEVIDNLIDELGSNKLLTDWVVSFANQQIQNERSWDVRDNLLEFSREIFNDNFKAIETDILRFASYPDSFQNLQSELYKVKQQFLGIIRSKATEALKIINEHNLAADDFFFKSSGVKVQFVKFSNLTDVKEFGEMNFGRLENHYQNPAKWPNNETPNKSLIVKLAQTTLLPLLNDILEQKQRFYSKALSAELVLNNLYQFGLLTDISRKLLEYKDENSIMLLADAPYFLNGVIRDSDTPFIYEKVGSFYKNFLIDEFQDTSRMQWENFFPLLTNALDQADKSMIVGDVKQAIYRWRGGDLSLLQQEVETRIGQHRVEKKELSSNYRSARLVVEFNNQLFNAAANWVSAQVGHSLPVSAYIDVNQQVYNQVNGFVDVSFIEGTATEKWNKIAMQQIPVTLERLQDLGVRLKDIAILVRRNEEGPEIVSYLLEYKRSKTDSKYAYDVVSSESLRLNGAASVNLLVAALQYLNNTDDAIARAQLSYEYTRLTNQMEDLSDAFEVSNRTTFENNLPEAFTKQKVFLRKLPLFELTESLINIFELGKLVGEVSYIQTFQDFVLSFSSRERNDLGTFLEWWEENKTKKSVQVSGEVDAAQIYTVHKAKGLQFKYVIIPFCSWDLDHNSSKAPLLWVKAEEEPFNKAGYMPVKYSSTLAGTLFKKYYDEERVKSFMDNLNLLYVALTRAEFGMVIFSPKASLNLKKPRVTELLFIAMQNAFKAGWNTDQSGWKSGEWSSSNKENPSKSNYMALKLDSYDTTSWREKLVIKQSSKGHFETSGENENINIQYGIHIHTIFSRITYSNELEKVLTSLEMEGILTKEERPMIRKMVDELLANPTIAQWFSAPWQVKTEVPILVPGGTDNRIDRLLINGRHAVIIDFKTGEPSKADQKQVAEYIETLKLMHFTTVEGYLVYLKNGEIISVPPGKRSKIQPKNENQLGLDF